MICIIIFLCFGYENACPTSYVGGAGYNDLWWIWSACCVVWSMLQDTKNAGGGVV